MSNDELTNDLMRMDEQFSDIIPMMEFISFYNVGNYLNVDYISIGRNLSIAELNET